MKETTDYSGLVEAIERGEACFLRLRIQDLPKTIDALAGLGLHKIAQHDYWEGFSGLCPQCTAWVGAETLGNIFMVNQMGREYFTTNQYGEMSHLLDLHCINSSCSSSEILLLYRGDEGIRKQLTRHLQRIKEHLTNSGDNQYLDFLDKLEDEQAISFAQDAIFGLERRCTNTHLIVGRRFSNIVIWVSFLPPVPGAIMQAFPKGYKSYLSLLLGNSGFDHGDIGVAHWISFSKQGQSLLNLAAVSDKNSIGTPKEFSFLPAEILQES
jgi:hypothetical protein